MASPHNGPALPTTERAASDSVWVMSLQISFTTLDSGPGSSPLARRDSVRMFCRRSTRSLTAASASASATSGSSMVPWAMASA